MTLSRRLLGFALIIALIAATGCAEHSEARPASRPRNYSWAELMRRVFEIDVLECPACQGPMRVLATVHAPEATRAILECLGLPSRSPPVSPADPDSRTDHAVVS